jgi:uncharacterized protein (TIGR03437 family)
MPQRRFRYFFLALSAPLILAAAEDRVVDRVDTTRRATIRGNRHPLANPAADRGDVDPAQDLADITVLLRPAAPLESYLAELQNPRAPNYRKWLTPEQFADRFGLSQGDLDQVTGWLRAAGLHVDEVARGRHWVRFGGTAERVGRALGTRFRRYRVNGEDHVANADEPSVPAALAAVVAGFRGLDDFLPQPSHKALPLFNSSTGSHALAPNDFATVYNVKPLYDAGIDGTGVGIAIVGQTTIDLTDLQGFRRRFGLPPNDPKQVLTGTSPGRVAGSLFEADLDLEWAAAVAPKADITYVYARSAFTALQYAIDQNLAPIVSVSFSACEMGATLADRYVIQQANAQGMTVIVSAGDEGAARCDYPLSTTGQAAKGATVGFPSAIPEVTSIGGTEFMDDPTYWAARNDATGASALSYIPEKVWNEYDETGDLHSIAAGGASANFLKPYWQTGPGVPNDQARDVPDLSLSAGGHVPYLVQYSGALYGVGGTSAGAPSFAGVVALLNDYLKRQGVISQPGLGNINPMMYRLAQSAPGVFHDIVDGDNKIACVQSSPDCVDGRVGYAAAPGYDLATGLGTIDANALVTQWTLGTASTTTVTASVSSGDIATPVTLTATVRGGGPVKPSGTVTFLGVSGAGFGSAALDANGTASVKTTVGLVASSGKVTAVYGGDGVYGPSTGTTTVDLNLPASGSLVLPVISPNPVPQSGTGWPYTITLTEKAGVATKLTGITIDGVNNNGNIVAFSSGGVSANGNIAAKGSITASLIGRNLTPPVDRVFIFTGQDADGTPWTQQVTASFVGPSGLQLAPAVSLTVTPATAQQNPAADPSCQWSQDLVLDEHGGYLVRLTGLSIAGTDASGQIQPLFGTARLAPYGALRATICWDRNTIPGAVKTYTMTGTAEDGTTVTVTARGTLAAAATAPAALSIGPQSLRLATADNRHDASAVIDVGFTGGAPRWTASVTPANVVTKWLQLSPISGTGNGQIALRAATSGLSNGVYQAMIAFEAPGASPDHFTIPVTLVVGASDAKIAAVANAASFQQAFAPGMLLSVYIEGLSGAASQASRQPLPLSLGGISATVNGVAAPIVGVYPAAGQINLQVPYEAGGGPSVLAVRNGDKVSDYLVPLAVSAPGLFGIWDTAGLPVASAKAGQTLIAYITGEGDVTPFLATGATPAFGTSVAQLPKPRQPLSISVGGVAADVLFAGVPSGIIGVTQINFTVPAGAPAGPQPVVVTVGGAKSQAATLNVGQ